MPVVAGSRFVLGSVRPLRLRLVAGSTPFASRCRVEGIPLRYMGKLDWKCPTLAIYYVYMSVSVSEPQADPALALLTAAVDGLQNLNLTAPSDEQLLDVLRELEAQKRRLAAVDHALIAEIEARGVARERGCAKSADLLVAVLRIAPGDANTRVRAATELGPRRSLTGVALPPLLPPPPLRPAPRASSHRPTPRCSSRPSTNSRPRSPSSTTPPSKPSSSSRPLSTTLAP